ncbi:pirin family protein [Paenibacillus spiritus]|uniref:Pirin family protein n=1 Tax=Paenibacillus spiritus TaxID=2496557 RepID=A0A5J5G6M6_9BACL|nr:pirin family protein [Paenibacillus spiritus]KAA9002116.1 pirin family protein [Paenibacillus spiritus]
MIKVVSSAERHTSNKGWIHSEFSFAFKDYDDPANAHFGSLLAHNDNQLEPNQGLHEHPHHDLEIVTYVVEGTLHHQDSLGNHADLQAGSVQVMSAGTGIQHSETNPLEDGSVRFLQVWLLPQQAGLQPAWDAKHYPREFRLNRLLPIVSGRGEEGTLTVNEDAAMYVSALETGQELHYPQPNERRTHLYVLSGHAELDIGEERFRLGPGDAARIRGSHDLRIRGTGSGEDAELVLIDLP